MNGYEIGSLLLQMDSFVIGDDETFRIAIEMREYYRKEPR